MSAKAKALAVSLLVTALAGEGAAGISEADLARITAAVPTRARAKPARQRTVLVFTLTRGFRHGSIPYAAKAFELMGEATGAFRTVVSEDISLFEPKQLARFDAVLLVNTTGELFLPPDYKKLPPSEQEAARERDARLRKSLLDFVCAGKGLAGVHSATDTFYQWPEFGEMMGGYFNGHPWHESVTIALDEPDHPLCAAFAGKDFEITDEIYQFREPYSRTSLRVLLHLDRERTPERGGRPDNDYAVSWIRNYEQGRVYYCSLGHRNEIYWNPLVLRYYLDGIQFVLGDLPVDATPSGVKPAPSQ